MSVDEKIKIAIIKACNKTSKNLSFELGFDVQINFCTSFDLERANQWKNSRFAGGQIRFDWKGAAFHQHSKMAQSSVFQLAAKKGRLLLGVEKCSFKPEYNPSSVVLETIEGSPIDNHPLKDKVIYAFSLTNIEIARTLNAKRIYVEQPVEETLPYYSQLGFRTGYFSTGQTFEAEMYI